MIAFRLIGFIDDGIIDEKPLNNSVKTVEC